MKEIHFNFYDQCKRFLRRLSLLHATLPRKIASLLIGVNYPEKGKLEALLIRHDRGIKRSNYYCITFFRVHQIKTTKRSSRSDRNLT